MRIIRPRKAPSERDNLVVQALAFQDRLLASLAPIDPRTWLQLELTMPQLKVLIELSRVGSTRVGELAHALNIGAPTASGVVDRLVRRGLVARHEAAEDRRATVVTLTEAGSLAVRRLFAASRRELRALLRDLSEGELRTMVRAMRILAGTAEHRAAGRKKPTR